MARYLITGGAGFIGSHLAATLVERGESVRVVDNLSAGRLENLGHVPSNRVEFIRADVNDRPEIEKAVRGIEVVFHQAAVASVPRSVEEPLETHAADATGTVVLLDACRNAGVRRVVYAASSSCYGDRPGTPKTEADLPQVLSPYAAAKLAGELYCEAFAACYKLETVRLRYFNVFGPRQDPGSPYAAAIPLFISALLDGRRPIIYGDGAQSRDFTYVANVVQANLLAADAPGTSGKVYNVACGQSITVVELLQAICRLLNKPYDPVFAPSRRGDVRHSWADISAAAQDLGYRPDVNFEQGLRETVDWYVGQSEVSAKKSTGPANH